MTILSDIQNAVNSRPLTYRCSDDARLEIITPNCFIKPYVNDNLLFMSNDKTILQTDPPTRMKINQSLKNRDNILEQFRNLWYEEYLISLREQWKDLHEINFNNKVKVDDVVLVKGPPDKKRPYWHLGRVLEVIPGSDGKVRSVKLKRADGDIAHHSLNHLYPMELALTHDHVATSPVRSSDQDLVQNNLVVSPEENLVSSNLVTNDNLVFSSGENLVSPDNLNSPVLVNSELESGTIDADIHSEHVQPFSETSVEDSVDQVESATDSYLVDDQVIDHYAHIENLDSIHDQGLNLVEVTDLPPRRPRRAATSRGRPLDDQFEYY